MKKFDIESFIAAIAGIFVIYLFTHHGGIGVSPDSVVYTSAARNLYHHGHFEAYNHMPLVDFPVLYPLFLTLTMYISGLDPVVTGSIINGVLFAILIYSCGHIMKQIIRSRLSKWTLLCGLLISPALLDVYTMLWSETLFITLSLLFFLLLNRYFEKPGIASVLPVAVCAGLACITRYAGVTFIAAGCFLIFFHPQHKMKKKLTNAIVMGAVSSLFLIANLVRNTLITGTFTGNREKSVTSFMQNMHYFGEVLYFWLPFFKGHQLFATFFAFTLLVLSIVAIIWRIRMNYNHDTYQNIALVFATIYILFIVVSASFSRYEQINNRLLSPAYAPLLLVVVYALGRLSFKLMVQKKIITIVSLVSIFAVFIASQVAESYSMYQEFNQYGIPGYTDDSWRHSPIVQHLQKHPDTFKTGYTIYSNAHEAAYFTANVAAESLPHTVDTEDVETFNTNNAHYLLWFTAINDSDLVSFATINATKNLVPVATVADGTIYWCTNKK